ncbi:MAG TPA: FAD-dependent oxidoreductase [Verrucomicrobiota bacterium]|nr:FAD-dependent oxidoreductase [Verrucomicrobiota bacterium]
MNRRSFFTLAGGMAGYTVAVRVNGLGAEPEPRERITRQFDLIAPSQPPGAIATGDPHLTPVGLEADVLVAGGGMAGVCAALAAARHGATVILVQDRSRLGGNSSSEVKMHIVGANAHGGRPGWREGGLIEELRLEDAVRNPQRSFELWDLLLYDKIKSEPNITLLLDTVVFAAETRDGLIRRVLARCDKTEHLYRIEARLFLDCTGDCRLGLEAGAEMRMGREAKSEFAESLAYEAADGQTQGSSILFTARDYGRPMPFVPPRWARKVTKEMLKFRGVSSWEYGYWWIEWGGQLHSIRDNERIRFELLSIVLGVWDYIKNSGNHPTSANWALDWVGMVPGKRESRRLVGDHVLTQHDLEGKNGEPDDAVAIGGWPMDDHPPSGFDAFDQPPFRSIKLAEVYSIPLRCLYSKTVGNLLMAGRNISASHVAFSSTRVMATCAAMGQAAGTAAALCARHGSSPRQLCADRPRLLELQQTLLRDDQTLKNRRNADPNDLARQATVTASESHDLSKPEHVINGWVRDMPTEWRNRWGARLGPEGAWIELAWAKPQQIRELQITFDTGFHRELTLSASAHVSRQIVRGPQPETVRDYAVLCAPPDGPDGAPLREVLKVTGNYQRLNRHTVDPFETKRLRLHFTATHGDPIVRVYEVRVYG